MPTESRATKDYLDLVNEILPKSTAMGAYAIGLITSLAWMQGLDPTRAVLEAAMDCQDIRSAVAVFEAWRALQSRHANSR
jgi:hypothetical protein